MQPCETSALTCHGCCFFCSPSFSRTYAAASVPILLLLISGSCSFLVFDVKLLHSRTSFAHVMLGFCLCRTGLAFHQQANLHILFSVSILILAEPSAFSLPHVLNLIWTSITMCFPFSCEMRFCTPRDQMLFGQNFVQSS